MATLFEIGEIHREKLGCDSRFDRLGPDSWKCPKCGFSVQRDDGQPDGIEEVR